MPRARCCVYRSGCRNGEHECRLGELDIRRFVLKRLTILPSRSWNGLNNNAVSEQDIFQKITLGSRRYSPVPPSYIVMGSTPPCSRLMFERYIVWSCSCPRDVDPSGQWAELKQLGGIGATALKKDQLDQIPMQRMATWYPRPGDKSPATLHALQAEYPSHYLDSNKGFLASLPAESRSLVSAVLYVRLAKMAVQMEAIEKVVWYELKRRIRLETIPLEFLYRRPSTPTEARPSRKSTSSKSASPKRSQSRTRRSSRQEQEPSPKEPIRDTLVEGVDYF